MSIKNRLENAEKVPAAAQASPGPKVAPQAESIMTSKSAPAPPQAGAAAAVPPVAAEKPAPKKRTRKKPQADSVDSVAAAIQEKARTQAPVEKLAPAKAKGHKEQKWVYFIPEAVTMAAAAAVTAAMLLMPQAKEVLNTVSTYMGYAADIGARVISGTFAVVTGGLVIWSTIERATDFRKTKGIAPKPATVKPAEHKPPHAPEQAPPA